MKPSEVADRAADLISKPNGWVQGAFAVDAKGELVAPMDSKAVAFCASGALARLCGLDEYRSCACTTIIAEFGKIVNFGMAPFNDNPNTTQEDVVGVFRKIAEDLREREM